MDFDFICIFRPFRVLKKVIAFWLLSAVVCVRPWLKNNWPQNHTEKGGQIQIQRLFGTG